MPTIVFISPKGGVGKTTSSMLLGSQFAKQGYPTTLIDADRNKPLVKWAGDRVPPAPNMSVVGETDEDAIIDVIDEAAARTPIVIVDLEGSAGKVALLAVSQADLVIIPMQPSELDASEAGRALRVVKQQERVSGRAKPHAVLFTRTSPTIVTRTFKIIRKNLQEANVRMFKTELIEREAFRGMFAFQKTLEQLDPKEVPNIPAAITNAETYMAEVAAMLRGEEKEVANG
jgi:chromosome partitioning protein